MSIITERQVSRGPLRADAEARLLSGSMPATGNTISMQALARLFRLACSPDSAADGLRLLHELQVHQVELDLQHAQLEASERAACESLGHYKTLFDLAPAGYLVTDTKGYIADANDAAAWLLCFERDELVGHPLDSVLAPGSIQVLNELQKQLQAGASRASGVVERIDRGRGTNALHVAASLAPGGDAMLVVLVAA